MKLNIRTFLHILIAFATALLFHSLFTYKVHADVSLFSPVNNTTYQGDIPIDFNIPDPFESNSIILDFYNTDTSTTYTMNVVDPGGTNVNFNLNPKNVSSSPNISIYSDNVIPDGNYNFTLHWNHDDSSPGNDVTANNIHIDSTTRVPLINSPVSSVFYHNIVPMNIIFPDTPAPGTALVTFTNTSTFNNYVLTLNTNSIHNFNFDVRTNPAVANPGDVVSSIGGTIPYGLYDMTVSYSDAFLNPVATAAINNFAIVDSPHIVITAPTKTKGGVITDTTIHVQTLNVLTLYTAGVSVYSSTTAGYSNFNCVQTNSNTVDCTISITSSGDLVIRALQSSGGEAFQTEENYVITTPNPTPQPQPNPSPQYIYVDKPGATQTVTKTVTVVSYTSSYAVTPVNETAFDKPVQTIAPEGSTNSYIVQILLAGVFLLVIGLSGGYFLGMKAKEK